MEKEIFVTQRCRSGHLNIFEVIEQHIDGATRYCSYCGDRLSYDKRTKFNKEIQPTKKCVHPKGYIKSVRICGFCGEQLSG